MPLWIALIAALACCATSIAGSGLVIALPGSERGFRVFRALIFSGAASAVAAMVLTGAIIYRALT